MSATLEAQKRFYCSGLIRLCRWTDDQISWIVWWDGERFQFSTWDT